MNKIILIGRLGRDAELAYTGSQTAYIKFSLAHSRKQAGERKTTWFECVMFGKRAEALAPYIRKGEQLAVEGSLEVSSYVAKDGQKKERISINVTDVTLLTSAPAGRDTAYQETSQLESNAMGSQSDAGDDVFL